jgi:26S proteasome regulatory subunit T2
MQQQKDKKKWEPPPPPPRVGKKQRRAAQVCNSQINIAYSKTMSVQGEHMRGQVSFVLARTFSFVLQAAALGAKLPAITPNAKCKLRLLKLERVKDWLLMEEEFVANQERLKPQEERNEEDRTKVQHAAAVHLFTWLLL